MNGNQKIVLGCGAAGCLGLILLAFLIVALSVMGYVALPGLSSNRNYNYNGYSNYKSLTNTDSDSNSNTDSSSVSSLSEDYKHKLFQAAGVTKDSELILRVLRTIGYPNGTGAGYDDFVRDHMGWAMKNFDF